MPSARAALALTAVAALVVGAGWCLGLPETAAQGLEPTFDGADAERERVDVRLVEIASGLSQPTDIQFPPGRSDVAVVLQKGGEARWLDVGSGESGRLFSVDVATPSEMGLLGLAFHPEFQQNGRFYLNYTPNKETSRIAEWQLDGDLRTGTARERRVLMEVRQPYVNHDAGQIRFGPDGMLYIGWGDGGGGGDPLETGQDASDLLGSMLRIDVDGDPYTVPPDNPGVSRDGWKPELYAIGLRNPWKFTFAPDGRMIVADVGQDRFEEVDLVAPGDNLGWNVREGAHCFSPEQGCRTEGLVDPIYEYGHDEGRSITGGDVYTGRDVPALRGRYVFGDFVTGRIWAIPVPDERAPVQAMALGRWPLQISTFGRDARGELYVGDFGGGRIFRIAGP